MVQIAHVHLVDRDYNAYISLCPTTNNIHVFKYNDCICEYDVFPTKMEAQIWINQNLVNHFGPEIV